MTEPRIIRKIRPRDIMEGKIKTPDKWDGVHILFTVLGKANGTRHGESTYGEFYALKGMFEAVREHDQQPFLAKECFLPEPMQSHIVEAIHAQEEVGKAPFVEFAFKIAIKEAETDRGYEYVIIPIIQPKATDELNELRKRALQAPDNVTDMQPELDLKGKKAKGA